MRRVILQREDTGDHGTFGRIVADVGTFFTGELPDVGNRPSVSCIPPGTYTCTFSLSPRFGRKLYLVQAVPNRSGVRIHPANFMGASDKGLRCELLGCIALGYKRATINGQRGIFTSLPAVRDFEAWLGGVDFILDIRQ